MTMQERDRQLLLQLRSLGTELALFNRRVAASCGIKEIDLAVLDILTQAGPMSPTNLSTRTRIHAATMTGVLARLERDGWIERQSIPGDRRGIQVVATNTERFDALYAEVNLRILDVLSELNHDESEDLRTSLDRVTDRVRGAHGQNGESQ